MQEGSVRRNRSRYALNQRNAGLCALARIKLKRVRLGLVLSILSLVEKMNDSDDEDSDSDTEEDDEAKLMLMMAFGAYEKNENIFHRLRARSLPRTAVVLTSLDDVTITTRTGFTRVQVLELKNVWEVPAHFTINEGRTSFEVNGETALLWFLSRFFSQWSALQSYENDWHYDYSNLSKIFKAVCTWFENKYRHLYQRLEWVKHRFSEFNEKIKNKIREKNNGECPLEAEDIALLYDGTRISICRLSGVYANQSLVYNKKYGHNAGALAHMGPDAMFYYFFTDTLGSHIDRRFMRDSRSNQILTDIQQGDPRQFGSYGDKGFDSDTHVMAAYHGPGHLTPAMVLANNQMKPARVPEEWGFGKLKSRCGLLLVKRKMQLQKSPVLKYIRISFLLCNAHTCLMGAQSAEYFDCMPPTLATYFVKCLNINHNHNNIKQHFY